MRHAAPSASRPRLPITASFANAARTLSRPQTHCSTASIQSSPCHLICTIANLNICSLLCSAPSRAQLRLLQGGGSNRERQQQRRWQRRREQREQQCAIGCSSGTKEEGWRGGRCLSQKEEDRRRRGRRRRQEEGEEDLEAQAARDRELEERLSCPVVG